MRTSFVRTEVAYSDNYRYLKMCITGQWSYCQSIHHFNSKTTTSKLCHCQIKYQLIDPVSFKEQVQIKLIGKDDTGAQNCNRQDRIPDMSPGSFPRWKESNFVGLSFLLQPLFAQDFHDTYIQASTGNWKFQFQAKCREDGQTFRVGKGKWS